MLITDRRIEVSLEMMKDENMMKGNQIGVPVDPLDDSAGMKWKTVAALSDDDYESIEDYFINLNELNQIF